MSRDSTNTARAVPKEHLMWRVVDYMNANPGEVLTRNDVAVKFNAAASTIDTLLAPAVSAGWLKRDHDTPDGTVWRHPKTKSNFPRPFTPSLAAAARASRAKRAVRRVEFDAIVIESTIPISDAPKASSQWAALFNRMRPGDSFQLPSVSTAALCHAKLKYCKTVETARFVTRKVSGTHTRIWRTA